MGSDSLPIEELQELVGLANVEAVFLDIDNIAIHIVYREEVASVEGIALLMERIPFPFTPLTWKFSRDSLLRFRDEHFPSAQMIA